MRPVQPDYCPSPVIIGGLKTIAREYDALLCDVWGVIHDGQNAKRPAVEALRNFRRERGPVILLSNAPRPVRDVEKQFVKLGVPDDSHDAIVTSGVLAHDDLARRSEERAIDALHIGPERDRGVFAGLPVNCVAAEEAEIIICTGLFDDDSETPEDYRQMLEPLSRRALDFLCINPDIVVQRGDRLIYCAGALARVYEQMGGTAIYYGKPHPPIYHAAFELAAGKAKNPHPRILVVGDGLATDIRGANAVGFDTLFVAGGIHAGDLRELTPAALKKLCSEAGVSVRAAMCSLVW